MIRKNICCKLEVPCKASNSSEKLTAKMTKAEESSPCNLRVQRVAHLITMATQSLHVNTPEFHCQLK